MGSVNPNLRGIRIKIAVFGTPKSGKYSFLQSMCKITSTQGNLQVFSDESGDVFSFVPIVRSIYSENINLQLKIMGARDKKGDGVIWQSIFKDIDGLIFICKARSELLPEAVDYLHKTYEYLNHFGPREYNVPIAIFYNKYESNISIEEFDKKVNQNHLRNFSGDLQDILPFITAVRYVMKEGLKKHQGDYERFGGKKNIEEAFEIVEVFRPQGVQMAESSVIINPPEESEQIVEKKAPTIPAEDTSTSLKEGDIEELSQIVDEGRDSKESTLKIKTPLFDISTLSEKEGIIAKMLGEMEQASQFFTLKMSDLKREYTTLTSIIEQIQSAYMALREENQRLSQKISEIKSQQQEDLKKVEELRSLKEKNKELSSILSEKVKEIEELRGSLARMEESLRLKESELDKTGEIKERLQELERMLSEKDRIIQDKESLLAIKVTEADELKEKIKSLEVEKEKIIIERRSIEDRLTVLSSKYKTLEEENKRLNEELSRLQDEALACRAESEELQSKLTQKEKEIEDIRKELIGENERLKAEIATLSEELVNKSAPSNDEEVRRLSSELVNLQIELAQRDERIKELEESLANKIKEIEELKGAKAQKPSTTDAVSPQMLAKTMLSNLKLKYWDDMLNSIKNGTFQKKYAPVFAELKKVYDSKVPESIENRDQIFQTELKNLIDELKKSI